MHAYAAIALVCFSLLVYHNLLQSELTTKTHVPNSDLHNFQKPAAPARLDDPSLAGKEGAEKFDIQYDKQTWKLVKAEREVLEEKGELDLTKWENIISWNGFVKRKYKGDVERTAFLKKFVDPNRGKANVDDLAYLRLNSYRELEIERVEKNLSNFKPYMHEKEVGYKRFENNCNPVKNLDYPDVTFAGVNLDKMFKLHLKKGGLYEPCSPVHNEGVNYTDLWPKARGKQANAILISYRNREQHLQQFIPYMHMFLQKTHPDLTYQIFVIEQSNEWKFNRAMLFNIGVKYVQDKYPGKFGCFTFTDVDSIPETGQCSYYCPRGNLNEPDIIQWRTYPAVHLARRRAKWDYKEPNFPFFGGISIMNADQLKRINGNPNRFYGWGGEDSALKSRIDHYKIPIERAHYGCTILTEGHFRDTGNETPAVSHQKDLKLEKDGDESVLKDGLNALKYNVSHTYESVDEYSTFTNVRTRFLKCMIPEKFQKAGEAFGQNPCSDAIYSGLEDDE